MEDIYLREFHLFAADLHVAWLGWVVQRQHWTCFGQHVPWVRQLGRQALVRSTPMCKMQLTPT